MAPLLFRFFVTLAAPAIATARSNFLHIHFSGSDVLHSCHHYVELQTVYERAQALLRSTSANHGEQATSETVAVFAQAFRLLQQAKTCSSCGSARRRDRNDPLWRRDPNPLQFRNLVVDLRDALTEIVVVLVPRLVGRVRTTPAAEASDTAAAAHGAGPDLGPPGRSLHAVNMVRLLRDVNKASHDYSPLRDYMDRLDFVVSAGLLDLAVDIEQHQEVWSRPDDSLKHPHAWVRLGASDPKLMSKTLNDWRLSREEQGRRQAFWALAEVRRLRVMAYRQGRFDALRADGFDKLYNAAEVTTLETGPSSSSSSSSQEGGESAFGRWDRAGVVHRFLPQETKGPTIGTAKRKSVFVEAALVSLVAVGSGNRSSSSGEEVLSVSNARDRSRRISGRRNGPLRIFVLEWFLQNSFRGINTAHQF